MPTRRDSYFELLGRFVDVTGTSLARKLTICGGLSPSLYSQMRPTVSLRPTVDIDVIVDVENPTAGTAEHYAFIALFEGKGFRAADPPICRYRHKDQPELLVDIATTIDTGIGPTNPWYAEGVKQRQPVDDLDLFVIPPMCFLATKLVAWKARGKGDIYGSKDLEDIFTVLVGIPDLIEEIRIGTGAMKKFVRTELLELVSLAGEEAEMMAAANVDPANHQGLSTLIANLRALR